MKGRRNRLMYLLFFVCVTLLSAGKAVAYGSYASQLMGAGATSCDEPSSEAFLAGAYKFVGDSPIIEQGLALGGLSAEADLVVIGETHIFSAPKLVLQNHLDVLYSQGYRLLGLEMLNRSSQAGANAYCEGKMKREQFIAVWRKNWSYGQRITEYIDMVERACELGFKLVALDIRDWFNKTEPEFERFEARNYVMAATIVKAMQRENTKAVVLTGSLHALKHQLWKSADPRDLELTRTTIPSFVSELRPGLKVRSVLIGPSTPLLNDERYCRPSSVFGEFNSLAAKSPYVRAVRFPPFTPVDLLLLQKEDQ